MWRDSFNDNASLEGSLLAGDERGEEIQSIPLPPPPPQFCDSILQPRLKEAVVCLLHTGILLTSTGPLCLRRFRGGDH